MSCRLESQRYFEGQQSAHAVTKEGDRIVSPSRRLHHRKDFVGEGGNTCELRQARPIALSGILDSDPFYVGGKLPGKRNIKFRGLHRHAGKYTTWARLASHRFYCCPSARSPSQHTVVHKHLHRHLECQRVEPPCRRGGDDSPIAPGQRAPDGDDELAHDFGDGSGVSVPRPVRRYAVAGCVGRSRPRAC